MSKICLCFQVHQPYRLSHYDFFKIGEHSNYMDEALNARILSQVAERCYLPANRLMKQLIELNEGKLRISFAFSGVFLEQCYNYRPDVIDSFRDLIDTGCVELLAMPYYASLASVYSPNDFEVGISKQRDLCKTLFGIEPKVLWNTALAYSNSIASQAKKMGLIGAIADGVDYLLAGKSNNELYKVPRLGKFRTFFRHHSLSTDLSDRRLNTEWSEYPLSPETYAQWVHHAEGSLVNIDLDYEVLGDRQDESSGVFSFWQGWLSQSLNLGDEFVTPSDVVETLKPAGVIDCPYVITRGKFHTTHDWLSNVLQNEAITKIYHVESGVKACADPDLLDVWRKLQTADHFLYMSEEGSRFSPFDNPYDMYISYMNALADMSVRVSKLCELGLTDSKLYLV